MLAVQWHPERMKDKDVNPLSNTIRTKFLEAIQNKSN
jgi:putative glutamine amidotransferase